MKSEGTLIQRRKQLLDTKSHTALGEIRYDFGLVSCTRPTEGSLVVCLALEVWPSDRVTCCLPHSRKKCDGIPLSSTSHYKRHTIFPMRWLE